MNRESSLDTLKGVGEKTKKLFERLDIFTLDDLIRNYPRTYVKYAPVCDISQTEEGKTCAVYAQITRPLTIQYIKKLQMVTAELRDTSGILYARWFNMPYLRSSLQVGASYVFYGKITVKGKRRFIDQPALYRQEQYQEMLRQLQPVYTLTKGISNQMISKLVRQALTELDPAEDFLPIDVRKRASLPELQYALEEIHFPRDEESMQLARRRLVFDEFLLFVLTLRKQKEKNTEAKNGFSMKEGDVEDVISSLGYQLTSAQQRVWQEVQEDMQSGRIMNRLIQGDVGSGKTILAFLSMILAARNGYQSALMVPTEVLAQQHYASFLALSEKLRLTQKAVLLTGSMTAREKREAYRQIVSHEADIVIGTHAVIQEKVKFDALGLVITDEQHRFGVKQREALGAKSEKMPHTIVMSATPIPRTLAVILYGDLDISCIDELPSNRIPIKNCVVDPSYRPKAYAFIQKEIEKGHQAYVICPMVEESELIEAEDVLDYTEKLKKELPDSIRVACLHGRMKPKEKNAVMQEFLENKIQVLVSTTVVEVGVNVPNATVMMIENAERFGLAQLHQLRGRVGRGSAQSYCIMINGSEGGRQKQRLEILNHSNDGFYIANEDLRLRGPGELLGVRQSGVMEFRIGDIYADAGLLQEVCRYADGILREDPCLALEKNRLLHRRLQHYLEMEFCNLSL